MANGIALGLRLDKIDSYVYVYMGDGELQEGSVWEAAMAAAHYKLKNIIVFIDNNGLQIDGKNEDVMDIGDIQKKFEAFGWNTLKIDGHNIEEIENSVIAAKNSDKPTAIIAKTVKGKGISFMENQVGWHGKAPSEQEFELAVKELQ